MMYQIDECLSLPEVLVKDAVRVLIEYGNLELTVEQMVEVIKLSKALGGDLYSSNSAGDTMTRELILDAVAEKLFGANVYWPSGMNTPGESKKFFKNLRIKALEAGYKIPRADVPA